MDNDLRKVKVGDYIWVISNGWVRVTKVDLGLQYQIQTEFSEYSLDGKYHFLHKYPSAFVVPPVEFCAEPKPYSFKEGDKVLVTDVDTLPPTHRMYFSHMDEKGMFCCYETGGTKWSSKWQVVPWKYCIPAEEEKL